MVEYKRDQMRKAHDALLTAMLHCKAAFGVNAALTKLIESVRLIVAVGILARN